MKIRDVAKKVVEVAGFAGGRDEVERIARDGWPKNLPIQLARLPTARLELGCEDENVFGVAIAGVAGEGVDEVEGWEMDACWEDDSDREYVLVTTDSRMLREAIQREAQEEISRNRSERRWS